MNTPSPSIRAWAERLLAVEAANPSASESRTQVAVRVFERLRISLTRFVGADGFTALQRRALAMARTDAPSLRTVKLTAEGRPEGIEEADEDGESATEMIAHLLSLLITFIGESLALRLMHDAFPDADGQMIKKSEES